MEDAHTTVVSMKDALTKWSFFAVFDGHAGKIAAEICSKDLVEKISKVLNEDVMKVYYIDKLSFAFNFLNSSAYF